MPQLVRITLLQLSLFLLVAIFFSCSESNQKDVRDIRIETLKNELDRCEQISDRHIIKLNQANIRIKKLEEDISKAARGEKTSQEVLSEEYQTFLLFSSLPDWCQTELGKYKEDGLKLAPTVNPFFQMSDFNGDSVTDIAIQVKNSEDQIGILIIHQSIESSSFLIGAGNVINEWMNDFNWMGAWKVRKGMVFTNMEGEKQEIKHDHLLVQKPESGGGLLYWDGKKYVWLAGGC